MIDPSTQGLLASSALSVPLIAIVPAYNEAPAIAQVVQGLLQLRAANGAALIQQVIVADNGSNDQTAVLAQAAGATVVHEARRGYGYACSAGINAAQPAAHLLFVDGDHSVLAQETPALLDALHAGADLVIGQRVRRQPGAMTLPQILGNALACYLARLIWRVPMSDLGPFRLIRREALQRIGMEDMTYGWTIEMQLKAYQLGLRVVEVPVTVQARVGVSKVSGTVRGVLGAGIGIFSMIGKLWWRQRRATPKM